MMRRGPIFDGVLEVVDGILDLSGDPFDASNRWRKLEPVIDQMLAAARVDPERYRRLSEILQGLKTAASELTRSVSNAKHGGPTRDDWVRFAERDMIRLKDELLALREFMVKEADFLRLACIRSQLDDLGGINPLRLFEELRGTGAISRRTWDLLTAQSLSWDKALMDRELTEQLVRISKWLLDLQEVRRDFKGVSVPGG